MPFTDSFFLLAGLCEIQLPSRTVRLCDGGMLNWIGRGTFFAKDPLFGTLESVQEITEAIADEAPMSQITLLPPSITDAAALFQPDAQGAPIFFWIGEVSHATVVIIGTPELQFSGFVDTLTLKLSRNNRSVEITFISEAERLFWTKQGNVLSPRFHKSVWPGELGLDHATGTQIAVPWGVPGPGRGSVTVAGDRPSGFGGIVYDWFASQQS